MPSINVQKVIKNPKFTQTFTVHRKAGNWNNGRFVQTETNLTFTDVVTACGAKELIQIPEADRTTGVMCFHSNQELFVTRSTGTSDEIEWNGSRYRVYQVVPWVSFGYWKAYGIRMVS